METLRMQAHAQTAGLQQVALFQMQTSGRMKEVVMHMKG